MKEERLLWPWEVTSDYERRSAATGPDEQNALLEYQERILILEREMQALKEEVKRLRYQKIEYRIDQLHIESLDGILNIGLSTSTDEEQLAELKAASADNKGVAEATGGMCGGEADGEADG